MELSSILKVQIKNLWKVILVFCAFFLGLSLVLLIPKTINKTVYDLIFSSFLVLSMIVAIGFAIEIYGNYGKTFIFIQNNRFNYIISGVIWNICISLILSLLVLIFRVCSYHLLNNGPILNFKYFMFIYLTFILMFNIGTIYSLFFKYHKKNKKILFIVLALAFLLFGYFTLPFIIDILRVFINFESEKIMGWYFIPLVLVDILIIVLTTIYYCMQNILKAYSNE